MGLLVGRMFSSTSLCNESHCLPVKESSVDATDGLMYLPLRVQSRIGV